MTDVGSVPVVSTGGGDFGGNGIWAILLLALLGGGGLWGNRGSDAASTELLMNNMNSRFNAQEGMAESRFNAQANNINHVEMLESTRDMSNNICMTQRMIQDANYSNALIEKDTQLQLAVGLKDAELQTASCCCDTNRNIDSVRFQNAQDTGVIIAAQTAGTQKILDKLCGNEIQALRDKIAELQANIARPAYITYAPGQSVFPPYPAIAAANLYGAYGCASGF